MFDFAWLYGMIFSFRADVVIFHNTTGAKDSSIEKQKVKSLVINISGGSDPLWILKLNLRPLFVIFCVLILVTKSASGIKVFYYLTKHLIMCLWVQVYSKPGSWEWWHKLQFVGGILIKQMIFLIWF